MRTFNLFIFVLVLARVSTAEHVCEGFHSCGECMSRAECYWCLDNPEDVARVPRCFSKESNNDAPCARREDPQSNHELIDDEKIDRGGSNEDVVLIAPQKASVKVRTITRFFDLEVGLVWAHSNCNAYGITYNTRIWLGHLVFIGVYGISMKLANPRVQICLNLYVYSSWILRV